MFWINMYLLSPLKKQLVISFMQEMFYISRFDELSNKVSALETVMLLTKFKEK